MSLPGANLVWHCPYFIIFSSDDGKVGGTNYKEYASVKLYGENDGSSEVSENHIEVVKTDEFPGWDVWKEINKNLNQYTGEMKLSEFAGQCRNRVAGGWDNYVI
jgi:hypothetical protein